jgi:hypothetical protein
MKSLKILIAEDTIDQINLKYINKDKINISIENRKMSTNINLSLDDVKLLKDWIDNFTYTSKITE